MLIPRAGWRWFLDESDRLAIDLHNELCFVTPYDKKSLSLGNQHSIMFNAEHMSHYMAVAANLDEAPSPLSAAERTQICLNATAIATFHKPLMPKTWRYAAASQSHNRIIEVGDFVQLQGASAPMLAIVVDVSETFVLVMQLSDTFDCLEGRATTCFTAHKVSLDRITTTK